MLWTELAMVAVLATGHPVQTQAAPAAPAPTARADRSQEVVCRNRAVTGSRFTHRRCQTREQARVAQQEAQQFVGSATRSGPSVEEFVNPLERSWIPQ